MGTKNDEVQMMNRIYRWALWITTIIIVLLAAIQALSGDWVTYFLLWPGGPSYGNSFVQAMVQLASYHKYAGFAVGTLSILALIFAFTSKRNNWVKAFSVVGFIMTALAASGGVLYVRSGFGDRMALGQMSDAFVGVFGAYFIQLFFMNGVPRISWLNHPKESPKMVRCKACGYIMKEGELADRCPACGAPRASFEPYNDPMSRPRRRVLKLQLHPIATHFPIAFVVAALVFSIATPFVTGAGHQMMISTTKIVALLIPFMVIITFWVGWWDGKVRFRKIRNSTILKTKILYAILLFVVTCALAVVVWAGAFKTTGYTLGAIFLSLAGFVLVFLLGLLGTSIMEAAFPG
ncbi:MAG TPA: hypothetical protein VMB24_06730 [Dehalococcoidales bacterium]|nr:hypothetical protein [Dehalococcoidales bacterium]